MQIKSGENRESKLVLPQRLWRYVYNKKTKVLFLIALVGFGCVLGMAFTGFFGTIDNPSPQIKGVLRGVMEASGFDPVDTHVLLSDAAHENYRIPFNYINGINSNPEHIDIDIKNNDFQKLEYKRRVAMDAGYLISSDEDYVPAKIRYNGETIDVKLRLKGDFTDHLEGDKWSFRVKVKGDDALFGMTVFSLQDPKTRNQVTEWIFHKALEREGLIDLRYDFIDISINGKHKGIYALEEHFDKLLIENNELREGPIIKFNEDLVWEGYLADTPTIWYYPNEIDSFQTNKIIENPALSNQYMKAKDLLESLRSGELNTSDVFDADKLARFFAVSNLMGASHTTMWTNSRFYYNPITSLLEPIGFDATCGPLRVVDPYKLSPYHTRLFSDKIFYEKYVSELERVSAESYLDTLFTDLDSELQKKIDILHSDNPFYHFSREDFYTNREYIHKLINPVRGINAYFNGVGSDRIILELGNIQAIPVDILEVKFNDSIVFKPVSGRIILDGATNLTNIEYEKVEFMLPGGFTWSDKYTGNLTVHYTLLGHSRLRTANVTSWQRLTDNFSETDFIRKKSDLDGFDFLQVDKEAGQILIKGGSWTLTESVLIPSGYTVVYRGDKPTSIKLVNNAKIVSHSPLQLYGSPDNPLVISSGAGGQGIAVLNADNISILRHVVLSNLSAPGEAGWQLSGAITFYESPVLIDNCELSDNTAGDDLLNIVRSDFNITNTVFRNSLSDAMDVDFGRGSIKQSTFINCGNDGMDFSGSSIEIEDCIVNGSGDKGLSAGENTKVSAGNVRLVNCIIGIASKDYSKIQLNNAQLISCDIGFAAFQKKPEFGPAQIIADHAETKNVTQQYLIEVDSRVIMDGKTIQGDVKDVYSILYESDDT